jgi:hypothetical protein
MKVALNFFIVSMAVSFGLIFWFDVPPVSLVFHVLWALVGVLCGVLGARLMLGMFLAIVVFVRKDS